MELKSVELGKNKIGFSRYFTREDEDVFAFDWKGNPVEMVSEDVSITDDKGKVVFKQPNVKRPAFWSSLATKVVASKYFWGDIAKGERENSVEQLIGRVSRYLKRQATEQDYMNEKESQIFSSEVAAICFNQLGVFNSPVWFNAGIQEYDENAGGVSAWKWDGDKGVVVNANRTDDRPQCSACFIQGIEDNMESIMALQVSEANLFKAGSGTGTNYSPLRSSKEKLTGGGYASGPVSFIKSAENYAGMVKSGGKTRRAAKMVILNISHPDIEKFIDAKQREEKKAWALIEAGYDGGMNGEAYATVSFQNCNMSVRVPDEFMKAVQEDEEWWTRYVKTNEKCDKFKAKDLIKRISEGTHICGDPGIQFDDRFNEWHTCKASGRINSTNPCSEYAFLDNSACNLASLNLMKFRTEDGKFDVESFKKAIRTLIISMDLIVDGASYPTEKICLNSHLYRPLGLGYANLGALLMSYGLPYDSASGRAVASSITAIMTGEAYKVSAELAGAFGTFEKYRENRESMMDVMKMHRNSVEDINYNSMPENLKFLVQEAGDCWNEVVRLGDMYGFRNAQVTVIAPTGTIGFMMDCDTTGIEPDIALVKYKVLAGGGMLKIVNRSVPLALKTLGYNQEQISIIVKYIDENDTIEGAPDLKEEHLDVFDCAFKAAKGQRFIHHKGHIKMMGEVQKFISGSISKTINMPESASVEDIVDAYLFAWERGLKAVAIYRENSKKAQALNTIRTSGERVSGINKIKYGERERLSQTHKSMTHKFDIAGHEGYITVGLYDDGRPGEIFITMHKQGSTMRGLMDAWSTSVSLNLQYGANVVDLFKRFRNQKFDPSGFVRNRSDGELDVNAPSIRTASSIVDYVAQFMLTRFGEKEKIDLEIKPVQELGEKEKQVGLMDFGQEGLTCPLCGGPAKRIGNCEILCGSCKQTIRSGCGE